MGQIIGGILWALLFLIVLVIIAEHNDGPGGYT